MADEQQPSQIEEEAAPLIALGEDAMRFISSTLGQYLLTRAKTEADEATELLLEADPNDKIRVAQLQNDAKRFRDFKRWLAEAINAGNQAYEDYLDNFNNQGVD